MLNYSQHEEHITTSSYLNALGNLWIFCVILFVTKTKTNIFKNILITLIYCEK